MRSSRWTAWRTIRVRLTLGYVVAFGLTLLLFGAYVHLRLERGLLDQADESLESAVAQASATIDVSTYASLNKTSGAGSSTLSPTDFAVRLLAPDGRVLDGLGDYQAVPIWSSPSSGYATLTGDGGSWRVYRQAVKNSAGQTMAWLEASRSLSAIDATVEELNTQFLLALPLALLAAAVAGLFLAERALRPIDRITRAAQQIGTEDLNRRIAHRGPPDELGRLAATLDQMLDRLQAGIARERRFTADAAHELRTPLTAIKGRIAVTLNRRRTSAEYDETLREVEHEVDRLIRLSGDLLSLARLDQGQLPRPAEMLDVGDFLTTIVQQLQPLAEARDLTLTADVVPGLTVFGDLDLLTQLILNLVDNALKFTPSGGRVAVHAEGAGQLVRIAVKDTGPGIPPTAIPHVFERFSRVETGRSRQDGGAGLGLAIAYEIARVHGGSLAVESVINLGSTFIVRLPIGAASCATASSSATRDAKRVG